MAAKDFIILAGVILITVGFVGIISSLFQKPTIITETITITTTTTERIYDCVEYATLTKLLVLLNGAVGVYIYYYDNSFATSLLNTVNEYLANVNPDSSMEYKSALGYIYGSIEALNRGDYASYAEKFYRAAAETEYLGITGRCTL